MTAAVAEAAPPASPRRGLTIALTLLSMLAFAGNSLLCRGALAEARIDAASFSTIRIVSGALVLALIVRWRDGKARGGPGNWTSAFALFAYAATFSFAYVSLSAGTGALLLFGAVQACMIGFGLYRGERLRLGQGIGLACALAGLVGLVLPGLSAPPPGGAALMLVSGVAWGVYSLRGQGGGDPLQVTAGNFLRAAAFAAVLSAALWSRAAMDWQGLAYAVASGAITSGIGYAIWYTALPGLKVTTAATVQLSVPVIAALGAIALLGESASLRFVLASVAILGGIGAVIAGRR